MARNEEKAQSMLNRWTSMKAQERLGGHDKRPFRTSDVTSIPEAERWRGELVRDISRAVTRIQNPYLGEQRIRELNDQINRMIREKRRWEFRIAELGGPNYTRTTTTPASGGGSSNRIKGRIGKSDAKSEYHYFGEARNLPGVQRILETPEEPVSAVEEQKELHRKVDPDYFGLGNENNDQDEELERMEREAERRIGERLKEEHKRRCEEQRNAEIEMGIQESGHARSNEEDEIDDLTLVEAVNACVGEVIDDENQNKMADVEKDQEEKEAQQEQAQESEEEQLKRKKLELLARLASVETTQQQ